MSTTAPWKPNPPPVELDPLGLGWTSRLIRAPLTDGMAPSDVYTLKLFTGLMIMACPVCVGWAVAVLVAGNVGLAVLIGVVIAVQLGALASALRRPAWMPAFVHAYLVVTSMIGIYQVWSSGGVVEAGGSLAWTVACVLSAGLLLGPRHMAPWAAFALLWPALAPWLMQVLPPCPDPHPQGAISMGIAIGLLGVFIACAVYWFTEQRRIVERQLAQAHAQAESLLHNVLPASVARRLQREGAEARHYDDASVLFADLVGFTPLSSRLGAAELVALLDRLFSRFDALAETHGVCKIKTIGDCYMVAAGIPEPQDDHLDRLAAFALDIRRVLAEEPAFADVEIRIGIASGPVVAGVIGQTRLLYDLWGDVVNTASRMESHGVPGAIQLTAAAAERLGARWELEPRGEIEVKGKGRMAAFLLTGRAA